MVNKTLPQTEANRNTVHRNTATMWTSEKCHLSDYR